MHLTRHELILSVFLSDMWTGDTPCTRQCSRLDEMVMTVALKRFPAWWAVSFLVASFFVLSVLNASKGQGTSLRVVHSTFLDDLKAMFVAPFSIK